MPLDQLLDTAQWDGKMLKTCGFINLRTSGGDIERWRYSNGGTSAEALGR